MPNHPERRLQIAIADRLDWLGTRPWTAFPAGEYRTEKTGALLKRLGLKKGWPDIIIIGAGGRLYGLELKEGKGRQTESQKEVERQFNEWGAVYHVARGYDEAVAWLEKYGFLRREAA